MKKKIDKKLQIKLKRAQNLGYEMAMNSWHFNVVNKCMDFLKQTEKNQQAYTAGFDKGYKQCVIDFKQAKFLDKISYLFPALRKYRK